MGNDPTKPKLKNITVNRLPSDLVIGFKALAIKLDCNIEDLMQCVLEDALYKSDQWFPAVCRLAKQKTKEREEGRRVKEQLKEIQKAMEGANV
jgi:hypothetical protein